MRTLYLECRMGAAGDMLTAALMELLPDRDSFIREMNAIGLPGITFTAQPSVKCGITGTHVSVLACGTEEESLDHHHDHETHVHDHTHPHDHGHHEHGEHHAGHDHAHGSMHDIEHIVKDHLAVSDRVKKNILAVYSLIADAESFVHGVPVTQIHFHEVGSMDALADVTAVCLLMEKIAPDRVIASPVHVGSGQVRCAHGILPVPAPATAFILKDVPVYGGRVEGELCTPTGAALLKHFASSFGPMPVMRTQAIGCGMGKKDFEAANCVRAFLGEAAADTQDVYELSCNIDDMTGEKIAFAMEMITKAGALDVYTIPIGMKKNRPGILLRAMCRGSEKDEVIRAIFRHTTTIGIRGQSFVRYVLDREVEEVETPLGILRRKNVSGYGVERSKWEYEDIALAARERGISISEAEAYISREIAD